jgi:predicted MFS family arabinose efflux permease
MRPATHASPSEPSSYRYCIIAVSFMSLAGASGASSAFAVFYPELLNAFGWSHASAALVYSVNMLVVAISSPLLGWLLDRFGPRWLFTGASVVIGLAFGACSRVTSLGQYALYYGVLSALGQTALLSTTVVVPRWFAQSQRGRAIGVADVGTGFGMVVLAPGAAWLITQFAWQTAFVVLGVVIILVLAPLNLLHRPAPAEPAARAQPISLSRLLRRYDLWTLCAAHLFMSITMTMVNVHLIEFLVGTGFLELVAASTLLGAVSLVSLPGRMFFGWLVDRLHPNGAFSLAMSCTMLGFCVLLLLAYLEAHWLLYTFVVIYGFAQGAGGISIAAKTVARFHGPYVGTMFMVVNPSGNLGAALGAWWGGRLFDLSGSYTLTFTTAIISGFLAMGCMWLGGSDRRPAPASPVG